MKELRDVLDNYLDLKASTRSSAKPTRVEQIAIKHTLPQIFQSILQKQSPKNLYLIKGSYGEGNLANIPWVSIFNTGITSSARRGYYIVLLFSQDMKSCYLSLNQGVTDYVESYGQANALQRMQKVAKQALNYFTPYNGTLTGKINLNTDGDLGRGYEKGNIEAFYYDKANLPTQEQFEQHVDILLAHYNQLFDKVGKNIQDIIANSEEDYQLLSLQKAALFATQTKNVAKEPKQTTYTIKTSVRDPNVAAQALHEAAFKCQIDPEHKTFITKATQKPYVEAHHLIPLGQQKQFIYSLDIVANIIILCPTCHRLLHHGTWQEKSPHLKRFLQQRQNSLAENHISVTLELLKEYYKHDIAIDD